MGVGAGVGEDGGGRGVFGRQMGEQVVVGAGERMGLSWGVATSVVAGGGSRRPWAGGTSMSRTLYFYRL